MKKYILIIPLLILFIGCNVQTTQKFRSYVTKYHKYDIKLYVDTGIPITSYQTMYGSIRICSKTRDSFKTYTWKSKGKDKLIFDSLSRIHNDMAYNKERSYIEEPHWGHCFYYDIASIDVVSEEDFDNNHPKGSSLKDVIRFHFSSLKKFIVAGYPEDDNNNPKAGKSNDKKLSEIGTNEMAILKSVFGQFLGYFIFDTTPTLSKTHHLTFTFHYTNGETYTAKVVKEFK